MLGNMGGMYAVSGREYLPWGNLKNKNVCDGKPSRNEQKPEIEKKEEMKK